jgi:hypothetical protein
MLPSDSGSPEEEPRPCRPDPERRPVTRPSLTRCRPAAADALGDPSGAPADQSWDVAARLVAGLRRDDAFAQFTRFVLVGATSTLFYALLFLSLRSFGYLSAHVVATVASSMLERVSWATAQLEAGGVSLFGLVATSTALGWLDSAAGSVHPLLQIALVVAVTTVIGLMRFVALRWIFRPAVRHPA